MGLITTCAQSHICNTSGEDTPVHDTPGHTVSTDTSVLGIAILMCMSVYVYGNTWKGEGMDGVAWHGKPPNVYLQTYVLTYKRLDDVNNSSAYRQGHGHGHD